MVGNLVVEIENFNCCLFVCLFTFLFVPHVLAISQEEGLEEFERFERFEGLRGLKVVWINLNKLQHN